MPLLVLMRLFRKCVCLRNERDIGLVLARHCREYRRECTYLAAHAPMIRSTAAACKYRSLLKWQGLTLPFFYNDIRCRYFDFNLCGLWFGHVLFEHRSGMVFVPSIIRLPHRSQMRPVGFAFIAYLQSGELEQEKKMPKRPR